MKNLFLPPSLAFTALLLWIAIGPTPLHAQASGLVQSSPFAQAPNFASVSLENRPSDTRVASSRDSFADSAAVPADASLPEPPSMASAEPAAAGFDHYDVTPSASWHQIPFSRIGIGADISPLGIGIKSAIVLNHYFDARLMGNFLGLSTGNVKVEGFAANANLHFGSGAAALDFYPFGSVIRVSPGLIFANGNQLSFTTALDPGTDFTLNGQEFYSAPANTVTGAVPLAGSGVLGLHRNALSPTVSAGFGKFIPRSDRHWSFPSEFGVAFTGAPTANATFTGWACTDPHYSHCGDVTSTTNPVSVLFNKSLQAQLTKWRKDLGLVTVYPLISYSVMYSFNIR